MIASCKELNLTGFIACICEQNYTCLGEGSPELQAEAWAMIYAEYVELMEDQVMIRAEALKTDIIFREADYKVIESAVHLLKKWKDEKVLQILKDRGFDFPFDDTDVEAYRKDLERVLTRSKSTLTEIANLKHELKQLSNEMEQDNAPLTRIDMMVNIMQFSQFMGFQIDMDKTTVEGFAAIRNLYYKKLNAVAK